MLTFVYLLLNHATTAEQILMKQTIAPFGLKSLKDCSKRLGRQRPT